MKCFYHKEREAAGFCDNCGKAICSECSAEVKEKTYCYKCMRDILQEKKVAAPGPVPVKKEEEKKKEEKNVPGLLSLIGVLMILGGLLEILVSIVAYLAYIGQMLSNPVMLARSGMVNVQFGIFIVYGLLIMIGGKKLKNLKKWGYLITYGMALLTVLAAPTLLSDMPEPVRTFYIIEVIFFVITMVYLLKVRKLFFGGKGEKKKKS